jgi:molybdopterin-guanine dinucleotide biosynthesis protein A
VTSPAPLAAIVLAGGASRRMGRDKATLEISGRTFVERAVTTLLTRCSPVFVVAAPGQPLPALDAEVLRDDVRGVGPLLATARGLRAAAEAGMEHAFVCAVDMPYLTVDLIDELVGPSVRLGQTWSCRGMVATTTWPASTGPTSRRGLTRWWLPGNAACALSSTPSIRSAS